MAVVSMMDSEPNIRNKLSRGYRLIIIAACGWLLAASPQSERSGGDQAASQQTKSTELARIATALERLPARQGPDAGCDAGEDDRNSDLCAQWKAADAAFTSAVWTERAFWLGIVGVLVGALTLGAAGFAAWYARQAWRETMRSANLAEAALAHSKDTFLSQNSPAIYLENSKFLDGANAYGVSLHYKNFGYAPAKNVIIRIAYKFESRPISQNFAEHIVQVLDVLPQGHTRAVTVGMHSERAQIDLVRSAKQMLVISVTLLYKDSLLQDVEYKETIVFDGQDIGYGVGRQLAAFDLSDVELPTPPTSA